MANNPSDNLAIYLDGPEAPEPNAPSSKIDAFVDEPDHEAELDHVLGPKELQDLKDSHGLKAVDDYLKTAYPREAKAGKELGTGALLGAASVPQTIGDVATYPARKLNDPNASFQSQDTQEKNSLFNHFYGKSGEAQAGYLGGQMLASAPLLAVGGEAAAPLMEMPGAAGAAARFMGGASSAEGPVSNLIVKGLSKAAQGATLGAATTGLTASGSNEDFGNQLWRNVKTGALLNPLLSAIPAGINKLNSMATSKAGELRDWSSTKLMGALQADGYNSVDEVKDALDKLGPQATFADLGENTRDLFGSLSRRPGESKQLVNEFVENRQVGTKTEPGQGRRIVQHLQDTLGVKEDFEGMRDRFLKEQAEHSSPLYKEAFSANKNMQSPLLDKILETDVGKAALSDARDRMNTQMALMGTPDAELAEQAKDAGLRLEGGVASGLKLRTLDYVKHSMDDMVEAKIKQVANGTARKGELSDLMDLRRSFVKELDDLDVTGKAGPNSLKQGGGLYAQARAKYKSYADQIDALDLGRNFMKEDRDDMDAFLDKMGPSEKQAARVGAVKGAQDLAYSTSDTANAAMKMFNNQAKRERFMSLFPDETSYDKFKTRVNSEKELFNTFSEVKRNSATARRIASDQASGVSPADAFHMAMDLKTGGHSAIARRIMNKLLSNTDPSLTDSQAKNLTELFLGNKPSALTRLDQTTKFSAPKSVLPNYINMLMGAYGVPATEMGVTRLRSEDQSQ